jgi:TPR repeat protein
LLGLLYERGNTLKKNYQKSFLYYQKGADLGDKVSIYRVKKKNYLKKLFYHIYLFIIMINIFLFMYFYHYD